MHEEYIINKEFLYTNKEQIITCYPATKDYKLKRVCDNNEHKITIYKLFKFAYIHKHGILIEQDSKYYIYPCDMDIFILKCTKLCDLRKEKISILLAE